MSSFGINSLEHFPSGVPGIESGWKQFKKVVMTDAFKTFMLWIQIRTRVGPDEDVYVRV